MKVLKLFAEYIFDNDVHFIEKCDDNEYINDYVYVEYHVTNKGKIFMDAEFTNDLPRRHSRMFAINVGDIVDHRVELLAELEKLVEQYHYN